MSLDNFFLAISKFRRRRFDESIELCNQMLEQEPTDRAPWLLKCRSLTKKNYLDDVELDEEGAGDLLMDDNATTNIARPGTSFTGAPPSRQGTGNPS